MTLQQLKKVISKNKPYLEKQFAVRSLYVFGSVARGEAKRSSDIDLLVDFDSDKISLFEFLDLKLFLESKLKAKVDLVTKDAIHKTMIGQIERDSIRVA